MFSRILWKSSGSCGVSWGENYVDKLERGSKKGLREKAEQGHWPTVARCDYLRPALPWAGIGDPDSRAHF
jgi:hypothetical protein